jgi:hypothetical protein
VLPLTNYQLYQLQLNYPRPIHVGTYSCTFCDVHVHHDSCLRLLTSQGLHPMRAITSRHPCTHFCGRPLEETVSLRLHQDSPLEQGRTALIVYLRVL